MVGLLEGTEMMGEIVGQMSMSVNIWGGLVTVPVLYSVRHNRVSSSDAHQRLSRPLHRITSPLGSKAE
jgi:hypothetical protein